MEGNGTTRQIRVLLVDDHAVVREGTKALLARAPDITLVAETESGLETVTLAEKYRPDVILLDIKLKGRNGVETARELRARFPEIKIVALTAYDFEPYVKAMMKIGTEGYILKDSSSEQIIDGIRTVSRGGTVFSANVAQKLVSGYLDSASLHTQPIDSLSPREAEVLQLLVDGKKNGEISSEIHLSLSTVEAHISSILSKLGARSRTEAVGIAVRRGLVVLDP